MTTALSVNLNKVAWLRNSREGKRPDVVDAARTVIAAGVQGITVHPRPDQRHIRPADVYALNEVLRTDYPEIEFNIEGNPIAGPRDNGFPGFDQLIEAVGPHQCTLVPDDDNQLTSDHGWDLSDGATAEQVTGIIERYHGYGARVSLFMDPDPVQIERAKACGTDRIELYTGPFADIVSSHGIDDPKTQGIRSNYLDATRHATQLGLGVNAGHDLDLVNLASFIAIGAIAEVSIGHALIADALEWGLTSTVHKYLAAIIEGST